MTVVDIELDMDFMAELDMLSAVPCETPLLDVECDKEAEWRWTFMCCGWTFLFCDMHHNNILEGLSEQGLVYCERCFVVTAGPDLKFNYERL